MDIPTGGWRPLKSRANRPGLMPYRYKLALAKGQDGSLTASVGFSGYRFVNTSGNMWLIVPELNLLPVVKQWVQTGRRELLTNIVVEEQDETKFMPPPGERMTYSSTPAGIVRRDKR